MEPSSNGLITRRLPRLADADPAAWNALTGGAYPFLRHEFLTAQEEQGCLTRRIGWEPHHLTVEDASGRLIAACPMYLKYNSFGEFVFDWAWAEAYERAGLDYYPKLVVAAPFTPATGPRLLIHPEARTAALEADVLNLAVETARAAGVSSLHWLFATDEALLESPLFLKRVGCQFHWENRGYQSFEDFLADLKSRRRKEILRERKAVREAGIELERRLGSGIEPDLWRVIHELYCTTFAKYGNYPAMTEGFFRDIATTMGEQVMVVLARRRGEIIGAAYFLVGRDALYGRYWGCTEDVPDLHFEACYYQGIEFCIETGLCRFEPGAQGEHKISRGFLPTRTWSLHWIAEPKFRRAIAGFLTRETSAMAAYIAELEARSPFKNSPC
ncbi:GNAT family N-acetyltransferase [Methylomagnum sp.]